jgi:hypothetical protein
MPAPKALREAITRRHFYRDCGVGLGKIALASLLMNTRQSSAGDVADPMSPRPPHFAPKAKRGIYLFMAGAASSTFSTRNPSSRSTTASRSRRRSSKISVMRSSVPTPA